MSKTILVTGAAGFIGSHVVQTLLQRGDEVVGLDNFNDYYDPSRKRANLIEIECAVPAPRRFSFIEGDVRDQSLIGALFAELDFDAVIHLAAMAGVRNSVNDPHLYYDVNLHGTLTLLDAAVGRSKSASQQTRRPSFVFATTSSAYGPTQRIPFDESDPCNQPLAPYAASKRAAELIGYTYHHLYGLDFTAVRLFTVYGPRNRPDMMAFKIVDNIFFGREVPLYNDGQMYRDWTYVEDIANGIIAAADHPVGYEVINLGRGEPVLLKEFVQLLEQYTGRKANLIPSPAPDTDIPYTYASIDKARRLIGYDPQVSVEEGVMRFWQWYRQAILKEAPVAGIGMST